MEDRRAISELSDGRDIAVRLDGTSTLRRRSANFFLERAKNNVGLIIPGIAPAARIMFGEWLYKDKKMFPPAERLYGQDPRDGRKALCPAHGGVRQVVCDHKSPRPLPETSCTRRNAQTFYRRLLYLRVSFKVRLRVGRRTSRCARSERKKSSIWSTPLPRRRVLQRGRAWMAWRSTPYMKDI